MHDTDNTANRVISLDLFRGITIAAMVLVNNQGDWGHVYPTLRHASWHGFSGADFVFPFFLFALGASLCASLGTRGDDLVRTPSILPAALRRTAILICLGLFLNLFPHFNLSTLRLPGVLQRIGLCYFSSLCIVLFLPRRWYAAAAVMILLLYGALLLFVTPEGFGNGSLDPCCSLPGFVDAALFPGHTYEHAPVPGFDPEGLLSTLPAIASTLTGYLALRWIRARTTIREAFPLAAAGAALAVSGLLIGRIIPINKQLWTPSYALFMSGAACVVFFILFCLYDIKGYRAARAPLIALGRNAIVLYVFSSLAGKAMATVNIPFMTVPVTVKSAILAALFSSWLDPFTASLFYSLSFLAVWTVLVYLMYRKKIFISI